MEEDRPFGELPQALVEEILSKCNNIGNQILANFNELHKVRDDVRSLLKSEGLLLNRARLNRVAAPTSCGIDGAYAIEKLLSSDLVVSAAVAIEGLTPPSEVRHWDGPHHLAKIVSSKHDVNSLPRGAMMAMELMLAAKAPHDIVMLDGSFTTPLIHMNQALNSIDYDKNKELSEYVDSVFPEFLDAYLVIATNSRSDKAWIYLPKYTTKNELKAKFKKNWPFEYDDRAILTQVMEPGEFLGPIDIEKPESPWHFNKHYENINLEKTNKLYDALNEIKVLYYKPNMQIPTLRIEISKAASININLIAEILECLDFQCGGAGIMEPYPLYMADRMAKSLGSAIPAFKQATTYQIASTYQGDVSDVFFGMHGYRTDAGRS